MKTVILTLVVFFTTISVSLANQPVVPTSKSQTIQVVENAQHAITVSWNDATFETVEIALNSVVFMPAIPTAGAQQIHLHNLEDGVYVINFRTGDEIVASKTVTIENHSILASNE